MSAALIAVVCERPTGQSVLAALREYMRNVTVARSRDNGRLQQYLALIRESEALREYGRRMWLRHEQSLTQAIREEMGDRVDAITCRGWPTSRWRHATCSTKSGPRMP